MGLCVFGILGVNHQLKEIHSVLEEQREISDRSLMNSEIGQSVKLHLPSEHMAPLSPKVCLVLLIFQGTKQSIYKLWKAVCFLREIRLCSEAFHLCCP
jgi:hypothetical protein